MVAYSLSIEYAELLCRHIPVSLYRFVEFSLPPAIDAPVHALRFRREGIGKARASPEPLLNIVRSPHRLVASSFRLACIGQPMTPSTAKVTATEIELGDPSPAFQVGAHKPSPPATIRAWGRRQIDVVSLRLPIVVKRQLYPVRLGGDTHARTVGPSLSRQNVAVGNPQDT